jgi:hypothetical protein
MRGKKTTGGESKPTVRSAKSLENNSSVGFEQHGTEVRNKAQGVADSRHHVSGR